MSSARRRIEKYIDRSENHIVEWGRCRSHSPCAILFVPPLIGGHYLHQLRTFQRVGRHGFDIVSFNYPGHGATSGRFSLSACLDTTRRMLARIQTKSRNEGLPLVGVGCCFGAIPLIHAAHRADLPFRRLVLINAIFDIWPIPLIRSFLTYYQEMARSASRLPWLTDTLNRYAALLFPGVRATARQFGLLERRRSRLFRLLVEAFTFFPLSGIRMPGVRTLCLYGRHDPILRIITLSRREYEQQVQRICPRVRFHPLPTDHYAGQSAVREEIRRTMLHFIVGQPFSPPAQACEAPARNGVGLHRV